MHGRVQFIFSHAHHLPLHPPCLVHIHTLHIPCLRVLPLPGGRRLWVYTARPLHAPLPPTHMVVPHTLHARASHLHPTPAIFPFSCGMPAGQQTCDYHDIKRARNIKQSLAVYGLYGQVGRRCEYSSVSQFPNTLTSIIALRLLLPPACFLPSAAAHRAPTFPALLPPPRARPRPHSATCRAAPRRLPAARRPTPRLLPATLYCPYLLAVCHAPACLSHSPPPLLLCCHLYCCLYTAPTLLRT